MEAAWASIIVGVFASIVSSAVTGAIAYGALKSWMARREEREASIKHRINDLEGDFEKHELSIQNHAQRLGVLEDRGRRQQQPLDYART